MLIFDLDETLIHTVRDTEDMEEQQLMMLYNDMYGVEPDEWVDIMEPDSAQALRSGFFVRPYLKECLLAVNQDYEVAVFTAGQDWYANPIIDRIDSEGKLI